MQIKQVTFEAFRGGTDSHLSFAVIMTRYRGRWVFVRHRDRKTLEIPGGRREPGESILETARRELFEETGAREFHLVPVETYQVHFEGGLPSSSGLLCYAEIDQMGALPDSEIGEWVLCEDCPEGLTYPQIQPHLFKRVARKVELLHRLMPYKHVIWDWNGTLVNDVALAVKAVGVLLEENQLPALDRDRYREVFGFPIKNYYEKIGFHLDKHDFHHLSDRFHEEYERHHLEHSRLFEDVPWQLELLKRTKKQSILSAAAQWHLDHWVKYYGIDHHFDYIYGINNLMATSKLERGRELIAHSNVPLEKTILVGDTDHDGDVARELGIHVLLISDGHQSFERLSQIHGNVLESRFLEI